jgi:hypothetical protein
MLHMVICDIILLCSACSVCGQGGSQLRAAVAEVPAAQQQRLSVCAGHAAAHHHHQRTRGECTQAVQTKLL